MSDSLQDLGQLLNKRYQEPREIKNMRYKSNECERMIFCIFDYFKKKIEPLSFQEAMAKKRNFPGLNCSTALRILP